MTRVSVVVIGRNEGPRLERCLASVQAIQGIVPHDVIYIDSGSTDGSPELADRMGAAVLPLGSGRMTAARARNLGWRTASGDAILFLDGDTILDPHFPQRAIQALYAEPNRAAVTGHLREINPCQSIYVRMLDLDWIHPPGEILMFGGIALIRREALQAVDGYNEQLIAAEDSEMCHRMRALGWRFEHIDAPMCTHDLAIARFSQYWRRSVRTGYAYAQVSHLFRSMPGRFWTAEARRNRIRGLFWMLSPLLAATAAIYWLSLWPVALWLLMLLALALRTALKQRSKGAKASTMLLYGIHSHLQQIPILLGQIGFLLDRRRNHPRPLIEYKDVK
jgi:cellulose synthase/poly-beta-1,6-N-acetylglucosamine synthase-like glycosyltransferase